MGRLFNGKHNLRVRGRKINLELEPSLGGHVGQYSTQAQSRGTKLLRPLPLSRAQSRRAVLQQRGCERVSGTPRHCERSEAIHSFLLWQNGLLRFARNDGVGDGLLRGACHRARVRATRWLAMTVSVARRMG